MKTYLAATAAVSLLLSTGSAFAQVAATAAGTAPDLAYEAVPNFFQAPAGDYMGELQGVATNSKGNIFAFFRGPQTRLWEFGPDGKFLKEIGKGFYGFQFAHSVRVDRHDNIWTVDEGTNVVTKFNPDRHQGADGDRPSPQPGRRSLCHAQGPQSAGREIHPVPSHRCRLGPAGQHLHQRRLLQQPRGEIFARTAISWPRMAARRRARARTNTTCRTACRWTIQGNVYVADRGNDRYVVLDNNLKWKTGLHPVRHAPGPTASPKDRTSICSCPTPIPTAMRRAAGRRPARSTRRSWTARVIGKFGHAGKLAPGFQVVHMMDCRNPNQIIVGEIESWRMQKFVLKGSK